MISAKVESLKFDSGSYLSNGREFVANESKTFPLFRILLVQKLNQLTVEVANTEIWGLKFFSLLGFHKLVEVLKLSICALLETVERS